MNVDENGCQGFTKPHIEQRPTMSFLETKVFEISSTALGPFANRTLHLFCPDVGCRRFIRPTLRHWTPDQLCGSRETRNDWRPTIPKHSGFQRHVCLHLFPQFWTTYVLEKTFLPSEQFSEVLEKCSPRGAFFSGQWLGKQSSEASCSKCLVCTWRSNFVFGQLLGSQVRKCKK